jgi:hypothetical protein
MCLAESLIVKSIVHAPGARSDADDTLHSSGQLCLEKGDLEAAEGCLSEPLNMHRQGGPQKKNEREREKQKKRWKK